MSMDAWGRVTPDTDTPRYECDAEQCPMCRSYDTQPHPIYRDEWRCESCEFTWGPSDD